MGYILGGIGVIVAIVLVVIILRVTSKKSAPPSCFK